MSGISFSILIANYNYANHVGAAIESCLAQRYPASLVETIVVDDGSTDGSLNMIDHYRSHPGVKLIGQANAGQAAAFAAGLERASGDFICLLDADDVYAPDKLARVANRLNAMAPLPEHLFLSHDVSVVDATRGVALSQSWFQLINLPAFGETLGLRQLSHAFPSAIPCGQVFSRVLLRTIFESVPLNEWRRGADQIMCQAAVIIAGEVHFLRERLAVYNVHGANAFAAVVDGQWRERVFWQARWPKALRHLELLIDSMRLDVRERNDRIAYLKRLENSVRTCSAGRKYTEPAVSVVVLDGDESSRTARTLASIAAQTHAKTAAVVVGGPDPADASIPVVHVPVRQGAGLFERMRAGYDACRGDYIAFLEAGAELDPSHAERHAYAHRFLALVALTASDIRVIDCERHLVHSGVFVRSGRWSGAAQQVAPFAARLFDWIFPPLSALVFRRTRALDTLFRAGESGGLADAGDLALVYMLSFMHSAGGTLRIPEALVDLCVADAGEVTLSALAMPSIGNRLVPSVQPDAFGRALVSLTAAVMPDLRTWLPESWHAQFSAWIAEPQSSNGLAVLVVEARRGGLERIAAGLQQAAMQRGNVNTDR